MTKMILHGYLVKYDRVPINKVKSCECPSCREQFTPKQLLSFPRQIWHPFRTYDFLRGYACSSCGYLATKKQLGIE